SAYLLTTPVPDDHIFSYKLQGAIAFSSWAFVLLGSPVLIAYGAFINGGANWLFYPALALFFLGFILIPGTIGALLLLFLVNILPRNRKQLIGAIAVAILGPMAYFIWHWVITVRSVPFGTRDWFWTIINEIRPLGSDFLPSHWISQGLQAAALGRFGP